MPVTPNANALPVGMCGIDPVTGDVYGINLCTPTPITAAGTTTVDPSIGHFFGFNVVTLGTSATMVAYDILGTSTTQLLPLNTATAVGLQPTPAAAGLGVRYSGALVVVTGGTVGQINVLWD